MVVIRRSPATNKRPSSTFGSSNKATKAALLIIVLFLLFLAAVFSYTKNYQAPLLSSPIIIKSSKNTNFLRGKDGWSSELCDNAQKIQVCSHQILHAPARIVNSDNTDDFHHHNPADGSLEAMEALWEISGIRCFDIDIVTLKDGTLLASHPSRLAKALLSPLQEQKKAEQYSLDELRKKGADAIAFPLLMEVLEKFASLVHAKENDGYGPFYYDNIPINKSTPRIPPLVGPLLNIDLKGPNLTSHHLQMIGNELQRLNIVNHVALCATALDEEKNEVGPGIDLLQALGRNKPTRTTDNIRDTATTEEEDSKGVLQLNLGLTLRDRVEKDQDTERVTSLVEQYPAIKLLVPSNKFEEEYFRTIFASSSSTMSHIPVTAWTVDDGEGLIHAIQSGLSAVVSNNPVYLNAQLHRIRQEQC
jgi:hypothetical protein